MEAVESHEGDFAAEGIGARVRLSRRGIGAEALDRDDREATLEALLGELDGTDEDTREDLRRSIVGIPSEADPADPIGSKCRKASCCGSLLSRCRKVTLCAPRVRLAVLRSAHAYVCGNSEPRRSRRHCDRGGCGCCMWARGRLDARL